MATWSFAIVYLRASPVIALDCVNATKEYAQGCKLVERGASPPRDALGDTRILLKELA